MKKETKKAAIDYEQPQVNAVLFKVEQGFANSTQLDDMEETDGSWEN